MSGGESAVLRSAKPHVGKENSMLPPLTSPSRVLSLSRGQKFANPRASHVRRPSSEDESKIHRATSPLQNTSPDKATPNQQRRIQQLEKSILFMREHHEKILSALHEEIEELKRKNKELNYRLVMSPASLPAHLLSPEEDQPPASSPRHQASRTGESAASAAASQETPVQLELLEGELHQLRGTLRAERERSERLAVQLRQAEADRKASPSPAPSAGEVTALEQRLAAAETTIRQLKKERDDCQREIQRMRGSVQFRPPWRAGPARPPPPAQPSRSSTKAGPATQQQQQLPRLPAAGSNSGTRQEASRGSTGPGRPADSRSPSQGSLPALPRGRARQSQPPPPPPPPPRHSKQQ